MYTVKKFHGGEVYTTEDGNRYQRRSKGWAVVNEKGQVPLAGKSCVHIYTTKRVAQYEVDRMNDNR